MDADPSRNSGSNFSETLTREAHLPKEKQNRSGYTVHETERCDYHTAAIGTRTVQRYFVHNWERSVPVSIFLLLSGDWLRVGTASHKIAPKMNAQRIQVFTEIPSNTR